MHAAGSIAAQVSKISSLRRLFKVVLTFSITIVVSYLGFTNIKVLTGRGPEYYQMTKAAQFLIATPACKIPNYEPVHPSVKAYFKKSPKINCEWLSKSKPVTTSFKNILYFHPERLPPKYRHQFSNNSNYPSFKKNVPSSSASSKNDSDHLVTCCYRSIQRITQQQGSYTQKCDNLWKTSKECYAIRYKKTVIRAEGIVVNCTANRIELYRNVHNFILQEKVSKKLALSSKYAADTSDRSKNTTAQNSRLASSKSYHLESTSDAKEQTAVGGNRLNVIIFGTDSVSRLNFLRNLPKTYKYLINSLEALEFKGYNKVGDNTFPNVVPILIGLSREELLNNSCMPKNDPQVYDHCPWLWKTFSSKGYITLYTEDSPNIGLFNYLRPGFVDPPTDYYGRPNFLASEKLIGRGFKGSLKLCQGSKLSIQVLQDYSLDFMRTFPATPTFSFLWSSSATHQNVNFAGVIDNPHLKYLKGLAMNGALNRTVLLFLSDHGIRFGKFRQTYIGMIEERLPYLFIVFPKWFKNRYPVAYSNLRRNAESSLTANYDIHETLLDIVNMKFANMSYVKSVPRGNLRGISLFRKIPEDRTCKDAGVPQHFCTCHEMKIVKETDSTVVKSANFVKNFLNSMLQNYTECLTIKTANVLRSHVSVWTNPEGRKTTKAGTTLPDDNYALQINLSPGDVLVEATVQVKSTWISQSYKILGEISRINAYGNQSHCIEHDILRKFCVCPDTLETR